MSQEYPSIINAAGSVVGGTGAALWTAGAAPARTGAGVYTLTLDQPSDTAACGILITPRAGASPAADITFVVAHTSAAVKTVRMSKAGVPSDVDFDFLVLKAPLS